MCVKCTQCIPHETHSIYMHQFKHQTATHEDIQHIYRERERGRGRGRDC